MKCQDEYCAKPAKPKAHYCSKKCKSYADLPPLKSAQRSKLYQTFMSKLEEFRTQKPSKQVAA